MGFLHEPATKAFIDFVTTELRVTCPKILEIKYLPNQISYYNVETNLILLKSSLSLRETFLALACELRRNWQWYKYLEDNQYWIARFEWEEGIDFSTEGSNADVKAYAIDAVYRFYADAVSRIRKEAPELIDEIAAAEDLFKGGE